MQLFFVTCNVEGYNFDWFISAPTPERAYELWAAIPFVREHWGLFDNHTVSVFRVPPVSPTGMPHGWHMSWEERGVSLSKEIIV